MSTTDWESKFNAIVRDTVHNLDRVKVLLLESLTLSVGRCILKENIFFFHCIRHPTLDKDHLFNYFPVCNVLFLV